MGKPVANKELEGRTRMPIGRPVVPKEVAERDSTAKEPAKVEGAGPQIINAEEAKAAPAKQGTGSGRKRKKRSGCRHGNCKGETAKAEPARPKLQEPQYQRRKPQRLSLSSQLRQLSQEKKDHLSLYQDQRSSQQEGRRKRTSKATGRLLHAAATDLRGDRNAGDREPR